VAGTSVNSTSIAISLVNLNDGHDDYTEAQIEVVEELVKQLKAAMPTLKFLTTHYEVSPKRKTDPIEFPVAAIAAKTGLTHWRFPQG
jgi:N-acetyl-anhydromuramyl-L-alanine amidase AmpD